MTKNERDPDGKRELSVEEGLFVDDRVEMTSVDDPPPPVGPPSASAGS